MSRHGIVSVLLMAMMSALSWSSGVFAFDSDEFDEYAFQSCITYCYANFRPSLFPTDHANCVNRCRRLYNKDRYDQTPRWKKGR